MYVCSLSYIRRYGVRLAIFTAKFKSSRHLLSRDNFTMSNYFVWGDMFASKCIPLQCIRRHKRTIAKPVPKYISKNNNRDSIKQIMIFENLLKAKTSYMKYFLLEDVIQDFKNWESFKRVKKEKELEPLPITIEDTLLCEDLKSEFSSLKTMDKKNKNSLYKKIIRTKTPSELGNLGELNLLLLMVSWSQNANKLCGEIVNIFCDKCTTMNRDLLFNVAKTFVNSDINNISKTRFLTTFLETVLKFDVLDKEDIVMIFMIATKLKSITFTEIACEKLESRITDMMSDDKLDEIEIAAIFNALYLNRVQDKYIALKFLETPHLKQIENYREIVSLTFLKFIFSHFGLGEISRWQSDSEYAEIKSLICNITNLIQSSNFDYRYVIRFLHICRKTLVVSKQIYSETFVDRIICDCFHYRLKDFGNVLYSMGDLGLNPQKSLQVLLRQFEKQAQLTNCKKDHYMINGLLGFSMMGIFPERILCFINNIQHGEDSLDSVVFALLRLDQSIKIDYPDYPGEILTESTLNNFSQDLRIFKRQGLNLNPKRQLSNREMVFASVVLELNSLGFEDMYDIGFLMSHSESAEILFCLDQQKKPIPSECWNFHLKLYLPLKTLFNQRKERTISATINPLDSSEDKKHVPDLDSKLALYILQPSAYICQINENGEEEYILRGSYRQTLNHARKLGYQVIEISAYEYNAVEDKKQFLKERLEKYISF